MAKKRLLIFLEEVILIVQEGFNESKKADRIEKRAHISSLVESFRIAAIRFDRDGTKEAASAAEAAKMQIVKGIDELIKMK